MSLELMHGIETGLGVVLPLSEFLESPSLKQLAARLAGVPVIVNTVHGFYLHAHMPLSARRFYIMLEKIGAHCSDLILSQNAEDLQTALREGICRTEKIRLLGNGIDLARFNPDRVSAEDQLAWRQKLGLAAETAFWYAQKCALQTQADAAALSGAYELLQGNSTNAGTWATRDAVLNGFNNTAPNSIDVSGCTGTACQVTLTLQHNTALASAFLPTVTIKAQARADLETFSSVACLVATGTGDVVTVSSNVTAPNCAFVVPTSPKEIWTA